MLVCPPVSVLCDAMMWVAGLQVFCPTAPKQCGFLPHRQPVGILDVSKVFDSIRRGTTRHRHGWWPRFEMRGQKCWLRVAGVTTDREVEC